MPLHTVVMLTVAAWALAAEAAVPAFIPYSGRLSDGTAWGQSTTLDLVLTVYDAQVDGTVVFQGKHLAAQVVDGYFTVNLGMCDAVGVCDPNPANATFPAQLPDALWLGVSVDGRPEMARVPVGSVPFAVACADAGTLAGAGPDGYIWNQTAQPQPGGLNVAGNAYIQGQVGIGNATPHGYLTIGPGAPGGDWTFEGGNELNYGHDLDSSQTWYINYRGYGTTQPRNLGIYDGKKGPIAFFDGANRRLGVGTTTPVTALDVVGNATVSGRIFAGCHQVIGAYYSVAYDVIVGMFASCGANEMAISGGSSCTPQKGLMIASQQDGANKWRVDVRGTDTTKALACQAVAVCCRFGN